MSTLHTPLGRPPMHEERPIAEGPNSMQECNRQQQNQHVGCHAKTFQPDAARIMIVDDEASNLGILEEFLRRSPYELSVFNESTMALSSIEIVMPDLLLLDVRMPGIDGFEFCRAIKNQPITHDIPIIFMSGLADVDAKIKAFTLGGVDYVTKPFNENEVLARINAHLMLHRQTRDLTMLVHERSSELAEANRLLRIQNEIKTHWISMVAHELRTPLSSILWTASVLFKKAVHDRDIDEMRTDFDWSAARIRKLIDDAIVLARLESNKEAFALQEISISDALQNAIRHAVCCAPDVIFINHSTFTANIKSHVPPELFERAICDLLITSACCAPSGSEIGVSASCDGQFWKIVIIAAGNNLPQKDLDSFFEIGGQRTLLKGGADFGLGPALAQRIFHFIGGNVSVRNSDQPSVVIDVKLPM